MATPPSNPNESSQPSTRPTPASDGANLKSLLTDSAMGIRIKGLVLAVEPVKEFKGTSKSGNSYAFLVREMQLFTGNKAVSCKDQRDPGKEFPPIEVGMVIEYKLKSVRMNGTTPSFELDTES